MTSANAAASGSFTIGGDLRVVRLGFGAMRITGPGIWGPPADRAEAVRTIRRVPELGIDFIDTADSYGPFVSEDLLAEILAPYPRGMVIATKAGLVRHGPEVWLPVGRPEYLKQCVLMSLRRLRQDRLDLWQLHRIDPKVPRNEQFDALAEMQREGLIRHLGLSEVSVEEIRAARNHFPVVTVQNLYNLVNRQSEAVLEYCEKEGIGFIPWFPLAAGALAAPGGVVDEIARRHGVARSAVAIGWLLRRSPVMLPIPGTATVEHLEENVAGASIQLSEDEFRQLDARGKEAWRSEQG
jgi:aryl-alcohol dehydrogenase-like predicted oxidoreductase